MKTRVVILGHRGMLGSMVKKYLESKSEFDVLVTEKRWPETEFKKEIQTSKCDYIINCIGAIHQKTKNFEVNYELPIWLSSLKCKVIHPGTDCESDSTDYGISKKKAYDFITEESTNTKIIKCSIIGPEVYGYYGLFEWFCRSKKKQVYGWDCFFWNGITTLKWAEVAHNIINEWNDFQTVTIPHTKCISKYDLLLKIKNTFDKKIDVKRDSSIKEDKCLDGNYSVCDIEKQLSDMKYFCKHNNFLLSY